MTKKANLVRIQTPYGRLDIPVGEGSYTNAVSLYKSIMLTVDPRQFWKKKKWLYVIPASIALRTKDIRGVYIITVDVQVEEKPVTQNIPEPPKN